MLGLGSHSNGPPWWGSARAQIAAWTWLAVGRAELDFDYLILEAVDGRTPADAGLTHGAGCLLAFPVEIEIGSGIAGAQLCLPPVIIDHCGLDRQDRCHNRVEC